MLHLLYRLYGRTIVVFFSLLENLLRFLEIAHYIVCRSGRLYYLFGGIDVPWRK